MNAHTFNDFSALPRTDTILNTGEYRSDAVVWGCDGLTDHTEAGGAWIMRQGDLVTLAGPEGCFEIRGDDQLKLVIEMLQDARKLQRRTVAS